MTARYKILILVITLTCLHSISNAQKCRLEKNDVDALTEMVIKRTAQELLLRINNEPVYFKAQCIGPNKYLKLSYYTHGNFSFNEEREIKLITTLNDEIVLHPRVAPKDTSKTDDLYNVRSLIVYKLSQEQHTKLKANGVIAFKYFVTTGWVERNIKTSKQSTIQELLICVD